MTNMFIVPDGEPIRTGDLKIEKARQIVSTLSQEIFPYIIFVEARRKLDGAEVIVFDVEVELGQRSVFEIKQVERIAAEFHLDDKRFPEVLALRKNFPRVPHLNLRASEIPRSLCLYEQDYNDIKLHWTPLAFIERIREWLSLTAKGKLHDELQPLEPFFFSEKYIILSKEVFSYDKDSVPSLFAVKTLDKDHRYLQCYPVSPGASEVPFVACTFMGDPLEHGIIYKQPSTINELHKILCCANINLLDKLRELLRNWYQEKPYQDIYNSHLMIITVLPKTRTTGGQVEVQDIWIFLCLDSVMNMGVDIGVWQVKDKIPGILFKPDTTKSGDNVKLAIAKPLSPFTKNLANAVSGIEDSRIRIVQIGVGALGSQIHLNLVRMGFGQWTLIDNDLLFPHNLARHVLHASHLGGNKAVSLQSYVNGMLNNETVTAFPVEIMDSHLDQSLAQSLNKADIILDISTSIPVARRLTLDLTTDARRVSMFMNPSGYDVVMLAEDKGRQTTLDHIEMQYYRYIIQQQDNLKDHLKSTSQVQYSRSCRDVSSTIPQDIVALQAAVCSRALRKISTTNSGSIEIWRVDPMNFSIQHNAVSLEKTLKVCMGEWTLCIDDFFLNRIFQLRASKLPNETGGVLIGSFDMQRKVVYIVDTIPSPPDSKEWPTVYIRGFQGLAKKIDNIRGLTAGGLEYVGEWHSHPDGNLCLPSNDDQKAFTWLRDYMAYEGKPALMMIAGDSRNFGLYLGCMGQIIQFLSE